MAAVENVLIVGAGLGGLALAAALGRHGIAVDVVERQDRHNAAGIGIAQPGNALRALDRLGVLRACLARGFQADQYRYFDSAGNSLANLQMLRIADSSLPAMSFMPRNALHETLLAAAVEAGARFVMGATVSELHDTGTRVEAALSNGAHGAYDLVIGADGIRSQVRQLVFGTRFEPRYTGHAAWRFRAARPPELTYQAVYLGVGARAGLVPMGPRDMFVFLVTNEPGAQHLPADRFKPLLRERLAQYTAPALRAVTLAAEEADTIVYTPLEEVVMTVPWFRGRIVLMGDAAHASSPHVAQGAAMALEDAVVLGELLGKDMPVAAALESYYIRRFGRCRFVQDYSRAIGKEGQLADPQACEARNAAIRERFAIPQPRPHEWVLNEEI